MRARKTTFALAVALAAVLASEAALAHRGGHHRHHGSGTGFALGLIIGAPLGYYYGRHAYAPYGHVERYYYAPPPPPAAVTAAPPHYAGPPVESRVLLPNYSYFCDRTNAYYPDVTECAGGWTYFPPEPRRY